MAHRRAVATHAWPYSRYRRVIPYLGPIIAAIPALLVALTKINDAVLWGLFAYLVIHQIEGHMAAPLIQRHMVAIPPAVIILGMVAVTYLFFR